MFHLKDFLVDYINRRSLKFVKAQQTLTDGKGAVENAFCHASPLIIYQIQVKTNQTDIFPKISTLQITTPPEQLFYFDAFETK